MKTKFLNLFISILLLISLYLTVSITPIFAQTSADWYMAGANPQRTSWVASNSTNITQVTGQLKPLWYRPLFPYVPAHVQPVFYDDKVFISSSNGLYVFNTDNGDIEWVFPTELPLGHSPTIVDGTVYVPGMDRTIYAIAANPVKTYIDSTTNYLINEDIKWMFVAPDEGADLAAGFEVNPLVVNNVVYVGNRNGYLYAVDATTGAFKWKYKTNGAIRSSVAYANNVVYVASMDGCVYAVDAATGAKIWQSQKLPGAGFYSYWPVIYDDYVLITGSHHYLFSEGVSDFGGGADTYQHMENQDIISLGVTPGSLGYEGSLVSPPPEWPSSSKVVRANIAVDYTEKYPERRRFFVLNQSNGIEKTFDMDNDGITDYAPLLWYGTHSGTRYPPVVGPDGTIYVGNTYVHPDEYIAFGQIAAWKFGTPLIRLLFNYINGIDEPYQASMGGNVVYSDQFYGTVGGANNTSLINNEWIYYGYDSGISGVAPNYSVQKLKPNNVYGGTFAPPVAYKNKVFILNRSSILAFSNTTTPATTPLSTANIVSITPDSRPILLDNLKQKLEAEILKFDVDNDGTLDHLRPGYHSNGLGDLNNNDATRNPEVFMSHYFHNPADTFTTLLAAYPYLSPATQAKVKVFLQNEYTNYNPCNISHIGWNTGAKREAYEQLPEFNSTLANFGKKTGDSQMYWNLPPQNFYALWKYALLFESTNNAKEKAKEILDTNSCRGKLNTPPSDSTFLITYPYILNDYINGYIGYIELVKLAGETPSTTIVNRLNDLKNLRFNNFAINKPVWPNAPVGQSQYKNILAASRNFIDLTPELADNLNSFDSALMLEAVEQYNIDIPYWFVSKYDSTSGEGILQQLFDYQALFQARAWVLKQPREELVKYLDVPAFERGDLFYIQNLVAAIEAPSSSPEPTVPVTSSPTPIPIPGDANNDGKVDGIDYVIWLIHYDQTTLNGSADGDFNSDGIVDGIDYVLWLINYDF